MTSQEWDDANDDSTFREWMNIPFGCVAWKSSSNFRSLFSCLVSRTL